MDDDYELWIRDKESKGWALPPKAAWPLRLPIIRHLRTLVAAYRVGRHQDAYAQMGLRSNGYDNWVLYAMWRGWC